MQQPQVDITLSNARIFDVNRFEIAKGEKFSLVAIPPSDQPTNTIYQVFMDNDPVLSVKKFDNTLEIEASEEGTSTLLFMVNQQIMKTIKVHVENKITPMATKLGIEADTPVLK